MKMLKQRKVHPIVGAIQIQFNSSLFYFSLVSWAMIAMTFWHTTGSQLIMPILPWLNFWIFCIAILVLVSIIMMLDYIFFLRSRVEFLNKQAYEHANPSMDILRHIEEELEELRKNKPVKSRVELIEQVHKDKLPTI